MFWLLDDFHAHTLSSKKSSYTFHDALQKRANAAFPQDVHVSYVMLSGSLQTAYHCVDTICRVQLCCSGLHSPCCCAMFWPGSQHQLSADLLVTPFYCHLVPSMSRNQGKHWQENHWICHWGQSMCANLLSMQLSLTWPTSSHKLTVFILADRNFRL